MSERTLKSYIKYKIKAKTHPFPVTLTTLSTYQHTHTEHTFINFPWRRIKDINYNEYLAQFNGYVEGRRQGTRQQNEMIQVRNLPFNGWNVCK